MALIRCRECHRDVSDTAQSCPHCGYADKQKQSQAAATKTSKELAAVALVSMLAVAMGAVTQIPVFAYAGFGILGIALAVMIAKTLTR